MPSYRLSPAHARATPHTTGGKTVGRLQASNSEDTSRRPYGSLRPCSEESQLILEPTRTTGICVHGFLAESSVGTVRCDTPRAQITITITDTSSTLTAAPHLLVKLVKLVPSRRNHLQLLRTMTATKWQYERTCFTAEGLSLVVLRASDA